MKMIKRGQNYITLDDNGKEVGRSRCRPRLGAVIKEVSLADFIYALDAEDDENWTKAGAVKMSVVEAEYGKSISRHDIRGAVVDYDREKARELQAGEE